MKTQHYSYRKKPKITQYHVTGWKQNRKLIYNGWCLVLDRNINCLSFQYRNNQRKVNSQRKENYINKIQKIKATWSDIHFIDQSVTYTNFQVDQQADIKWADDRKTSTTLYRKKPKITQYHVNGWKQSRKQIYNEWCVVLDRNINFLSFQYRNNQWKVNY